ncbi:hypothetical protein GFY24_13190 [Nocardia sp. SYP-A9097]|uniref:hypothetical protein n=1 Tax=Nocardia sp. SYP-A9097 TaxID=2663237 RepID=UPI00129A718D|nr:hypothetical protein [Nocardia sp. SYP-A9097]MRH88388.1 hypothetical protein [Nocardia sp. SYP-A9097]
MAWTAIALCIEPSRPDGSATTASGLVVLQRTDSRRLRDRGLLLRVLGHRDESLTDLGNIDHNGTVRVALPQILTWFQQTLPAT